MRSLWCLALIVGLGQIARSGEASEVQPELPAIPKPESVPEVVPNPESTVPVQDSAIQEALSTQILKALQNSSSRYPAFVNPTGQTQPASVTFDPKKMGSRADLEFKIEQNQVTVPTFAYRHFPKQEQLYWVLPGNRIVMETQGWQGEIEFQGKETDRVVNQSVQATQALWGLQSAWILPQPFDELLSQDQLSILSIAAEANTPDGTPPPVIEIDRRRIVQPNVTRLAIPRIGTGSTSSPLGGGSLFENLALLNSPKILQAFPTNNLQVLLEGEGLFEGARIPKAALARSNITFGNPLTKKGFRFDPEVTSVPGIKTGQLSLFDNPDLLNVLINPFLDRGERDLYYLNSLHWVSLGLRQPKVLSTQVEDQSRDWYQISLSRPHNRTLLQYDKTIAKAEYSNVFSNPGVSLSYAFSHQQVNRQQSINASLGRVVGSLFEFFRPARLEKALWEARLYSSRGEVFTSLRSQSSADDRRQMNQRLERTLNTANRTSKLDQVSGSFTTMGEIRPQQSQLLQFRAGNYQRRIRFFNVSQVWTEGDTFISKLRISNDSFGALSLIGNPIPDRLTPFVPNNRASEMQIFLNSSTQQFELVEAPELTTVPIGIRAFSNAFDRIELSQIGNVTTTIHGFDGMLHLPAVEAVWTKTKGQFSYSLSSGIWANFNPDVPIVRNLTSDREPILGVYLNGFATWIKSRTIVDSSQKVTAIVSHLPAVQLTWNSAMNPVNPTTLTLSYAYLHQTPQRTLTVTGGVLGAMSREKFDLIAFLRNQMTLAMGLEGSATLELSDRLFCGFELLQALSSRWALGAYGQNFRTVAGLNSREPGNAYGLIVQRRIKNTLWQSRLGMNGDQFEMRFSGNLAF